MAPLSALCERSDYKLVHLNSSSYNGEFVQPQSALNDDYNNFQEKSNTYHISKPIIGRCFSNLVLVRSLRSSFIDSLSCAKKHTSQGFGAFSGQSCDRDRFLFPFISDFLSLFVLFLDFIAISNCVFNNKNNYSTRVCWISNNYNHFGAMRLVGYLSYPAHPRCTQICVYPPEFMMLRVAQFSLKIAHLSFSMGLRGFRAYGLRPRF